MQQSIDIRSFQCTWNRFVDPPAIPPFCLSVSQSVSQSSSSFCNSQNSSKHTINVLMAKQWTDERDLPPFQLCQGIASLSSALKQFVDNCKGFLLVRLPQLKSLQLEKGQKKMNLNVIVVGG